MVSNPDVSPVVNPDRFPPVSPPSDPDVNPVVNPPSGPVSGPPVAPPVGAEVFTPSDERCCVTIGDAMGGPSDQSKPKAWRARWTSPRSGALLSKTWSEWRVMGCVDCRESEILDAALPENRGALRGLQTS